MKGISVAVICGLLVSGCVYSPLSRNVLKWTAESCGRDSIGERLCSGVVTVVALPVYVVTMVMDIPLAVLEFWFGVAPFDDPLVDTAQVDFEPHRFKGNSPGETWIVQRRRDNPERFDLIRKKDGDTVKAYIVEPRADGTLRVGGLSEEQRARIRHLRESYRRYTSLETY